MWVNVKPDEAVIQVKWIKATLVATAVTCISSLVILALLSGYGLRINRLDRRVTSIETKELAVSQQTQPQQSLQTKIPE